MFFCTQCGNLRRGKARAAGRGGQPLLDWYKATQWADLLVDLMPPGPRDMFIRAAESLTIVRAEYPTLKDHPALKKYPQPIGNWAGVMIQDQDTGRWHAYAHWKPGWDTTLGTQVYEHELGHCVSHAGLTVGYGGILSARPSFIAASKAAGFNGDVSAREEYWADKYRDCRAAYTAGRPTGGPVWDWFKAFFDGGLP